MKEVTITLKIPTAGDKLPFDVCTLPCGTDVSYDETGSINIIRDLSKILNLPDKIKINSVVAEGDES